MQLKFEDAKIQTYFKHFQRNIEAKTESESIMKPSHFLILLREKQQQYKAFYVKQLVCINNFMFKAMGK